jgi:predicted nucleic acid-binding protein
VILVDTGPLVALFDPKDGQHDRCRFVLRSVREALFTTVPVLAETFHMLGPESHGSMRLRDFVLQGGLSVWFMTHSALERSFELMEQYADHLMDLADASLIVAAEATQTRKIFTIDGNDFSSYRIRHGHRHEKVEIIG